MSGIFRKFRWRISGTFLMVFAEAVLDLLYPLLIGLAVNDVLQQQYTGLFYLGILGLASLTIGSLRRFYDTRVYSGIYQQITPEMIAKGQQQQLPTSTLSARANLLTEFVEFLENEIPQIIVVGIGMVGTILLLASLNWQIMVGCLGLFTLVLVVYAITGYRQYQYHGEYNSLLENQVSVIQSMKLAGIKSHFGNLMQMNIKLSDLETWNYMVIWLGAIVLFIASPLLAVQGAESSEQMNYGTILSIILYVFEFIEKVVMLPLFIQQLIRLKEISNRINREVGHSEPTQQLA